MFMRTIYTSRNKADIIILNSRKELYCKSHLPSSVEFWNKLPLSVRNVRSFRAFKQALKSSFKINVIPGHFVTGKMEPYVHLCRLRNKCSNLNHDLFNPFMPSVPKKGNWQTV